jgi:hypothetical protein
MCFFQPLQAWLIFIGHLGKAGTYLSDILGYGKKSNAIVMCMYVHRYVHKRARSFFVANDSSSGMQDWHMMPQMSYIKQRPLFTCTKNQNLDSYVLRDEKKCSKVKVQNPKL